MEICLKKSKEKNRCWTRLPLKLLLLAKYAEYPKACYVFVSCDLFCSAVDLTSSSFRVYSLCQFAIGRPDADKAKCVARPCQVVSIDQRCVEHKSSSMLLLASCSVDQRLAIQGSEIMGEI